MSASKRSMMAKRRVRRSAAESADRPCSSAGFRPTWMAMPSSGAGPARTTTTIGAARLAVSVAPARVGQNTIKLTPSDPRTGRPYTATKQLTVTATLTRQQIGPLTLHVHGTGPGRFTTTGAVLGVPGTWTLQVTDRTSAFDETQRLIQVLIS